MLLVWAVAMAGDPSVRPARTILDYAFLAYVVAELLASAFSLDPAHSFINAKRLLLIGIVYALASTLLEVRDQKRAVAVLLGAAGVVGTIGVAKMLLGWIDANQRLGVFQFYMTTAGVMMIAALLLIPFAVHPATPRRVRIWSIVALVPVVISLYATVTRGAYLAVVAGAIAIAVIRNRRLLVPLAAVVALTIIVAPPFVESRIRSIVDLQHPENASRLMVWTASTRIVAEIRSSASGISIWARCSGDTRLPAIPTSGATRTTTRCSSSRHLASSVSRSCYGCSSGCGRPPGGSTAH